MRTKFDLKKANLGIGLPVLAAEYTPKGVDVLLQGENGILGIVSYWRANKMKIS
jgi:acyl CoA:acetate/3-ketoacid CoA transferase beta subunit